MLDVVPSVNGIIISPLNCHFKWLTINIDPPCEVIEEAFDLPCSPIEAVNGNATFRLQQDRPPHIPHPLSGTVINILICLLTKDVDNSAVHGPHHRILIRTVIRTVILH